MYKDCGSPRRTKISPMSTSSSRVRHAPKAMSTTVSSANTGAPHERHCPRPCVLPQPTQRPPYPSS